MSTEHRTVKVWDWYGDGELDLMFRPEYTAAPLKITATQGSMRGSVDMKIADLSKALTEVADVKIVPADAIVIERALLSEVTVDRHGLHVDGLTVDSVTTYADARRDMLAHAALAEYLKAQSPVDEAQVEALAADILHIDVPVNNGTEWPQSWARLLVAAGWSK